MFTTHWIARLLMISVTAAKLATAQIEMSSRSSMSLPISGQVTLPDPLMASLMRVQVVDLGNGRVVVDQPLGVRGAFQLPSLAMGFYELRILGGAGEVRHSQELHTSSGAFLQIHLGGLGAKDGRTSISALRLMHQTPKKAQKELKVAAKALQEKDRLKAIEHLEKAAVEDPESFEVVSNLGALYLQESKPDQAAPWLERAYRIDPNDSVNNVNLSAYYANRGDYVKAEEHAAAGVRMDPNSVRGRFMLAVALVRQGKDVEVARGHLNQIQNQFGPARSLLLSLKPQ